MSEGDPGRYGKMLGGRYDNLYPSTSLDTEEMALLLADLAKKTKSTSLLEFGIGTGRLAIAVLEQGINVSGVDSSPDMVRQLREKVAADCIPVVVGDYRNALVEGAFGVVALVFNGIFDPRGREAQFDIFENAARHLERGGYFVVESWVMIDAQRNGQWSVIPRYVGPEHVELQFARYDIASNQIERTLLHLRPTGSEFLTVRDTYAAPGELDVIAHATGFERVARYANWKRDEYTSVSAGHVSVYQLTGSTRQR
jgi:SAM-dependent methyltransferase